MTIKSVSPALLPSADRDAKGHPITGSRAVFELGRQRTVLCLNTASVCCELLEALRALEDARLLGWEVRWMCEVG